VNPRSYLSEGDGSARPDALGLVKPHVLVVDGRPADSFIVGCYLQQFGCPHDVAVTFEDAIRRISGENYYDAIIIDVAAPRLGAADLIGIIRRREQTDGLRRAQLIALAAFAPLDDPKECLKAGLDDYLSKPCNPRALAQKLGLKEMPFAERWPTSD